jgi:hypothetical protein
LLRRRQNGIFSEVDDGKFEHAPGPGLACTDEISLGRRRSAIIGFDLQKNVDTLGGWRVAEAWQTTDALLDLFGLVRY